MTLILTKKIAPHILNEPAVQDNRAAGTLDAADWGTLFQGKRDS